MFGSSCTLDSPVSQSFSSLTKSYIFAAYLRTPAFSTLTFWNFSYIFLILVKTLPEFAYQLPNSVFRDVYFEMPIEWQFAMVFHVFLTGFFIVGELPEMCGLLKMKKAGKAGLPSHVAQGNSL